MRKPAYASLLLLLALYVLESASAAGDDGTCRNGSFPSENANLAMARIVGSGRTYLLGDMQGCPKLSVLCEKTGEGYVLPGDELIIGRAKADYVCAYYPSRGGGSAGWVNKSRLNPYPVDAAPPVSSWTGRWSQGGNPELTITSNSEVMHVTGEAFWPGPHPAKDWPSGWPHTGQIDGVLTLNANRAHYDADTCKVSLTLLDGMIIASDNTICGGMNVRFDGVYRRVRE